MYSYGSYIGYLKMYYVLICLQKECSGSDITQKVYELTDGDFLLTPTEIYNFILIMYSREMIVQTKIENRVRYYIITEIGLKRLKERYKVISKLKDDYDKMVIMEE